MEQFKSIVQKGQIEPKAILDLFCFRNPTNMLFLRKFLGDEDFLALLDNFNGMYIRFPKHEKMVEIWEEAVLAELHTAIVAGNRELRPLLNPKTKEETEKRDAVLLKVGRLEFKFQRMCDKLKIDYKTGQRRARAVKKELKKAAQWRIDVDSWDNKEPKEIL